MYNCREPGFYIEGAVGKTSPAARLKSGADPLNLNDSSSARRDFRPTGASRLVQPRQGEKNPDNMQQTFADSPPMHGQQEA
jgi:hypothetical protein